MSVPRTLYCLLVTISTLCSGQPILPSLSYPVFLLTPPDILKTHAAYQQHAEILRHPPPSVPAPQEPGYEVSQFHSQDELGRVVFGFHGPDQSRMESRGLDGTIRGSYSYVDPNGNIVKMEYWDDGSGFHVSGNALPNGQPGYTPEVAAARAQHLRIHQQIRQHAQHLGPISDGSDDDLNGNNGNTHFGDTQFDKETNGNSLFHDDTDTVSLDNPELFGDFNYPDEEDKDKDKPTVSDVEGEVDLGEDILPDEEEEQEGQNYDEEIEEEIENHSNFGKHKNNKKVNEEKKAEHGSNFKIKIENQGKDENGVKTVHEVKNQAQSTDKKNDEEDENEEEENQDDDENNDEEEDEEGVDSEGYPENVENHDDHEEGHEDDGEESDKENDHYDGPDHLFQNQEFDFNDRHDNMREEEMNEHSDVETAENRKAHISQSAVGSTPNSVKTISQDSNKVNIPRIGINAGGFKERIEDQNNAASYSDMAMPSFDPSRKFFYHYYHTIPKPVERVDEEPEKNPILQNRAHDPRSQAALIRGRLSSRIRQIPTIIQPSPDMYQQSSNVVKGLAFQQPGLIVRSSPTEMHDVQVSPHQSGGISPLTLSNVPQKVR